MATPMNNLKKKNISNTLNNSTPTHITSPPDIDHHQDALYQLLREVQLERFYIQIRSLDVTKVEHFVNVVLEDLTGHQVGMGAPAGRRLLEAAKKRNASSGSGFGSKDRWNKNLLNIIIPNKGTSGGKKFDKFGSKNRNGENGDDTSGNGDGNPSFTCLISAKDIKLMDRIGNGSFGVVMRASWTQPMGKPAKYVAVKVLKQEILLRAIDDFSKEVDAMHQLCHPNLIKLFGIVLSSPMMMVTELAEQGSLRLKLIKTIGRISLFTLADFALQIATGMEYLEGKRLIHRDLAARNIFLTETNMIKIGDFGLMRSVPDGEDYYTMSDGNRVPFPWCAIESLKYRQFSHASDTWMYGVTLWEIFSFGQEPWAGLNGSQIIKKLQQGSRLQAPPTCPRKYFQAMQLCWLDEPNDRPTFTAMIKFFKEHKPIKLRVLTDFDITSPRFAPFKPRQPTSNSFSGTASQKYLSLKTSEEIDVVEGSSDNYWWKGQSQRTWEVGIFPRCVATDLKSLKNADISLPVKNSFIHTGHQDAFGKNSWGNPQFIEKMFLEHPMLPKDVFGNENNDEQEELVLETRAGHPKTLISKHDKKIDKISNLEELSLLSQAQNNEVCEDLLIDLSSESIPDVDEPLLKSTPTQRNISQTTPISNDLIDICFDSILDSSIHETVVDWSSCNRHTESSVEQTTENVHPENNFFIQNGATFDTIFDTSTTYGPTTDIATTTADNHLSFMDDLKGFTEYKLPQPEAIEIMPATRSVRHEEKHSQSFNQKERYYSSVYNTTTTTTSNAPVSANENNSNCDSFPAPPSALSKSNSTINYSNFEGEFAYPSSTFASHASQITPYDAAATCQCCSYYNTGVTYPNANIYDRSSAYNGCTSGCQSYQAGNGDAISNFALPPLPPPPPLSGVTLPPSTEVPPPLPSQPPVVYGNDSDIHKHNKSFINSDNYRTDDCRNIIRQLEKDFSKFATLKNSSNDSRNDSGSVTSAPNSYPNIVPPPKSNKIRRPAPKPPSGQRKVA